MLCRRCRNSNLGQCKLGYKKTEEQIIREQYSCFQERILEVNKTHHHPDFEYNVYLDEVSYDHKKFHADMRKAERNLRKNGNVVKAEGVLNT